MSTESSSATPAPASAPFVYVNGDKLHLMEDYRLPLFQYFPEGTKLFDPTYMPPREIPLSTSMEEAGVTLPKLQPNAQYHAFFKDPRTGSLYAAATKYVCLYVSHLPFNTTTEMLGRYFETFDMVKAADVFPGPKTSCNGRGWVILQDPSKLLLIPRVLQFYGKHFIFTELSDREPSWEKLYAIVPDVAPPPPPPPPPPPLPRTHSIAHRMDAPPPPLPPPSHNPNVPAPRSSLLAERRVPPAGLTPIGGAGDYEGPALPAPRSQQRLQQAAATGQQSAQPQQQPVGSAPVSGTGSASLTPATSANNLSRSLPGVTFVAYISEKDAEDAVRDGFFWPNPVFAAEVQECFDGRAAAVYVIFLFASPPTVFGYAKVLPRDVGRQREAKMCPIEWVHHHCFLPDAATRPLGGVVLMKQHDGSQLKPEVGQHVRDFIDAHAGKAESPFAQSPSGPSIPLPRGRGGVGRGARGFNNPPAPIGRGRGGATVGGQPTPQSPQSPQQQQQPGSPSQQPPLSQSSEGGLTIPIPASRRAAAAAAAAAAGGGSSPTSPAGLHGSAGASPVSATLNTAAATSGASTAAAASSSPESGAAAPQGGKSAATTSLEASPSSPPIKPPAPASSRTAAAANGGVTGGAAATMTGSAGGSSSPANGTATTTPASANGSVSNGDANTAANPAIPAPRKKSAARAEPKP